MVITVTNGALLGLEPGVATVSPRAGTRLRVLRPEPHARVRGTVRAALAGQDRPCATG